MPTLRDAIRAIKAIDVEPSEIKIPNFMYSFIVGEAQKIADADVLAGEEGDDDSDDDD
jgi:hypothetical protein